MFGRAFAFAALTLFSCTVLSAGLITGVTINSFSSEVNGDSGWNLQAVHLVDGSGLSGGFHGDCHENGTCWQNGYFGGIPAWVIFDLNDAYTVDSIHIWNGYWADYESGRSANSVEISTSDNLSDWTDRGTYQFPMAPDFTTNYAGFELGGLGWSDTRYVRFVINSNYGGGSCGGCVTMAEVQFFGASDGSEIPEPGTIWLVSIAGALMLWRRRASRC